MKWSDHDRYGRQGPAQHESHHYSSRARNTAADRPPRHAQPMGDRRKAGQDSTPRGLQLGGVEAVITSQDLKGGRGVHEKNSLPGTVHEQPVQEGRGAVDLARPVVEQTVLIICRQIFETDLSVINPTDGGAQLGQGSGGLPALGSWARKGGNRADRESRRRISKRANIGRTTSGTGSCVRGIEHVLKQAQTRGVLHPCVQYMIDKGAKIRVSDVGVVRGGEARHDARQEPNHREKGAARRPKNAQGTRSSTRLRRGRRDAPRRIDWPESSIGAGSRSRARHSAIRSWAEARGVK